MWQFGLKSLLGATLLVAMACAVFFALPIQVGLLILVVATLALAAPIVGGVVYGRGYSRAFAIGALSAYVAWVLAGIPVAFIVATIYTPPFGTEAGTLFEALIDPGEISNDVVMPLRYFTLCWPLVAVAGLLAMAVRWRSRRKNPNS